MTDAQFRSLRTALLLVAAGLFANAAAQLVPPAIAAERVDARIENAIDVDETKCQKYRRDGSQIKIVINYKASLETCEYDKYI